jgi:ADP-heptose:LPS heptosyltransferase
MGRMLNLFLTQSKKVISDRYEARKIKGNRLQKVFSDASSRLTNHLPQAGAHGLDAVILPLLGSPLLAGIFAQANRRIIHQIKSFRRILVVSYIHIGDGVLQQSVLTGLRDFFPDAQVDYVVGKAVYPLIAGNPEATTIYPLFFGDGIHPPAESLKALRELYSENKYDLCINMCPYIRNRDFAPGGRGVLNFKTQAAIFIRNEYKPGQINHFTYQSYRFIRDLLSLVAIPVRPDSFKGVRLILSDSAVEQADHFATTVGLAPDRPVIFYNPDTATRYTLIPFDRQVEFLLQLARFPVSIVLGEGHTNSGIGIRLKAALPALLREKVSIIPAAMALDTYSALIDRSDVFISGDTGPLHIAATRKFSASGRHNFRNRTAVLSIFGATPARMSGYDSTQPGYLPANQDAPSWSYAAKSPCRNITCLNKLYKTCPTLRCFEEVDVAALADRVRKYLDTQATRTADGHGTASVC